jgi:hypothetical protein
MSPGVYFGRSVSASAARGLANHAKRSELRQKMFQLKTPFRGCGRFLREIRRPGI